MKEQVPLVGVDLYCPDCHRLLVSFGGDGTAMVMPRVVFRGSGVGEFDDDGKAEPPEDLVITEALCMHGPCERSRRRRAKEGSSDG